MPDDLESVTTIGVEDAAGGGMSERSVQRIWDAAVELYRSGVHPALQVCVRREGEVVLDRAIGHARGNGPNDPTDGAKEPATPATPFVIYSGTKAPTAFLVHMLHERGALEISDRVSRHIPGYERHGKDEITIGHVLAHRAGVPNLPSEAFDLDRVLDHEFMVHTLCEARPIAKPGRFLAYHAVSGGHILGEIVNRVTGKDMRTVLAEEILEPLGFRWTNYGVAPEDTAKVALNYLTGTPTLPPLSQLLSRALGLPLDSLVELSNDDRFLTGIVPAANIVSTANELSRFYEILRRGGELDGVRVVAPETVRRVITQQSHLEVDLSLGFPTRFGSGVMLGAQVLSLYGLDTQHAFGHLGFTNMLAWADPERALACAVMTNGKPILYPELARFYLLAQRITSEAPKVRGSEMVVWDPLAARPGDQ
ncbi:MAG TPA: serine hydrolase domain-containing protein [Solirubrobacteraceae bacterium]|nr:serine hydrolase domain-containing protein [Solirubrobacteraceae bacterium]